MLKKTILSCLTFFLTAGLSFADDFSQMNPTVKVTSYKKLFIDQVTPFGSGSGTVVSPDGIVITNHHVIFDDDEFKPLDGFEVCITFKVNEEPECKYTARLIAHDKDMDIALLKINDKDVFGKTLPALKFLDYQSTIAPKEEMEVSVIGYPGSGGETITITKGQISGFEEFNGLNYFKTDTDFDHGSSGGTALDPQGNYIGIPTYIRSYAENVGFFLDLQEARGWIDENITKTPIRDLKTERLLKADLARISASNDGLSYQQEHYPHLAIDLPKGWEFIEINDDSFFATQKNLSNPVGLSVFTSDYQFEVGQGYLDKLDEELEGVQENFPDYKKEEITFAGEKAFKISYTSLSNKNTTIYIPYGYTMVGISYSIDLDESDKQEKAIKPVLDSFEFAKSPLNDPDLPSTLVFADPPFDMTSAGDFRFQKSKEKRSTDVLAEAVQKDNYEGNFTLYYNQIPKDERHLTAKERLDEVVKALSGRKLVYKNENVVLGGLKGFLYTFEYEGRQYQQIRKRMSVVVRNGDYEFSLDYDDLTEDFDKNLPVIQKMLDSFRFKGELTEEKVETSYGNLGFTFNDIQFHRFAQAISALAEKEIVKGYSDGGFHPEQLVSRVEALKMILESKNHLEIEKGSKDIVDFSEYESSKPSFRDVGSKHDLLEYVEYAKEMDFVSGYAGRSFRPNQHVNLVEALKLITHAYEIPVWAGTTNPWFKKYMDKGFELGLIPYGMYEPNHLLTRAELAHLVNTVYKQAKN